MMKVTVTVTVQQMINELQKFDPNDEVAIQKVDGEYTSEYVPHVPFKPYGSSRVCISSFAPYRENAASTTTMT